MARYTQAELDKLKNSLDLVALIQSKGIKLEPHGKDLKGLCPFHKDSNPSMIITPGKNLFHCPACSTGGDVISFVQKYDGLSFTHAVELLMNGDVSKLMKSTPQVNKCSTRKLKSPIDFDAGDQVALRQVIAHYANNLVKDAPAREYLKRRGLYDDEAIKTFQIGFSDRNLGNHLPDKTRVAGKKIRSLLAEMGIYRASGHEHFAGSLVFPIISENSDITEVYGRKVLQNLRKGTAKHLYLPGPHLGIWNPASLKNKDIILTEAIIDGLTFWVNGFRNVTASYGTAGFTKQMLAAFIDHKIERVFIAYDNDQSGNDAAQKLAATLIAEGIKCFRVRFPFGLDANAFALKAANAGEALQASLNSAEFMDSMIKSQDLGASPEPREGPAKQGPKSSPQPATKMSVNSELQAQNIQEILAATPPQEGRDYQVMPSQDLTPSIPRVQGSRTPAESEQSSATGGSQTPPPAAEPAAPKVNVPTEIIGEDIFISLGDRKYRVRGLAKNSSYEILKVNIRASKGESMHVDTLDLFNARHRKSFTHTVASELQLEPEVIKRDMGRILLKLEELQEEALRELHEPATEEKKVLSEQEETEALELLRSPQLIRRIISDVRKCGLVGEDVNALVAYLAATSRKTDDPLAVIIQSSSAAGKSSVMNAILGLMPDEDQVIYTAMTGQSLFYMGENQLKNKILAIAEEEGAEQAGYALKILQSEKKLKIASTGKDPKSGRLVTQEYNVEGPCAIFMTTTSVEIDEELQNRCLVLTVNEDREQTRKIHELQRKSRTLEGLLQKEDKKSILRVHANAQRLLQPLLVVNPFAHQLTFLDNRLRARRDNIKYLNLISAVALIHQFQREIKAIEHQGSPLPYIEVQISDIETANKLAASILGTSLDDLAPQTRKLLDLIYSHANKLCEEHTMEIRDVRLTRRSIRAATGWTDTRLRIHLQRLVELEYLSFYKKESSKTLVYELLYTGQGQDGSNFSMNLIDTSKLTYDEQSAGLNRLSAGYSHPISTPSAGHVHSPILAAKTSDSAPSKSETPKPAKQHLSGAEKQTEIIDEGAIV